MPHALKTLVFFGAIALPTAAVAKPTFRTDIAANCRAISSTDYTNVSYAPTPACVGALTWASQQGWKLLKRYDCSVTTLPGVLAVDCYLGIPDELPRPAPAEPVASRPSRWWRTLLVFGLIDEEGGIHLGTGLVIEF